MWRDDERCAVITTIGTNDGIERDGFISLLGTDLNKPDQWANGFCVSLNLTIDETVYQTWWC